MPGYVTYIISETISDGTQAIYSSDDFFKGDTNIIDTAANQFAVIDEFYFYVKNVKIPVPLELRTINF